MEQKSISSDLIRGHIDTIILHSLIEGDKFAQQISDSIEEKSGNTYKMNQATLYSSLKRLESLKFVTSYWHDIVGGANGGRRKYFKLTESGKKTVDENLSSWSYSRAIIDKLTDCEPSPVVQTKIIEKIVEVPVEKIVEVPVEKTVYVKDSTPPVNQTQNNVILQQEQSINVTPIATERNDILNKQLDNKAAIDQKIDKQPVIKNDNDVNFRNILGGLIKTTAPQKPVVVQQPTQDQVVNETNIEQPVQQEEKLKFNETLESTAFNKEKVGNNDGKVDFGDLIIKAAKEGYKLRVSAKDSGVSPNKIFVNKLNLSCALSIFLIVLLEFLFFTTFYKKELGITTVPAIIIFFVLAIFPVVQLINYFKKPHKTTTKEVSADTILTAAVIAFNIIIVTLAINLFANVNFASVSSLMLPFIVPCVLSADIVLYYIIKYISAKLRLFRIQKKVV